MNFTHEISQALKWAVSLVLATSLAGCGSGKVDDPCSGLVAVVTAGMSCWGSATSTTPSSPPPPPPPAPVAQTPPGEPLPSEPPPEKGNTVIMNYVDEYEPNNSFDNANPVHFRAAAPDEHVGIRISGTVEQSTDGADFFIFTPPRTDLYLVYLCTETCSVQPATDEVTIAVYDQSQTTLASTPVGTIAEQRLTVELEAGLPYYVEISGYNTVFEYDYRLVVID